MARIHTSLDLKRGLQLILAVIDHSDNLRNAVRSPAITAQNKRSHSLAIRGAQFYLVTIWSLFVHPSLDVHTDLKKTLVLWLACIDASLTQ